MKCPVSDYNCAEDACLIHEYCNFGGAQTLKPSAELMGSAALSRIAAAPKQIHWDAIAGMPEKGGTKTKVATPNKKSLTFQY